MNATQTEIPAGHFDIAGRRIGGGAPPFLIAEIGINHGGDADMAMRMVEAAAAAGADAVKLQTFETARFLSRHSDYFDVLQSCELPHAVMAGVAARARDLKLVLFSSCFDEPSADLWNELGAPLFKIASGDITHLPLLRHIAAFGKPMIVSTGGATVEDIGHAVQAINGVARGLPIGLLHCVSNYPTEPRNANLACMAGLRRRFGCPVGFSDHTLGGTAAIAAVALGAELIEKHFTLDKALSGPDHGLSADPADFLALSQDLKAAHLSIGRTEKRPVEAADFIPMIRRSVTAAVDIPSDTPITPDMLAVKRPGTGIQPAEFDKVLGRRARRDIPADTTLSWSDLQ